MDEAIVVFSRKGLFKTSINARDIRSREQARKLWPMVAPDWRLKTYDFGPHQAGFGAFSAQTDASVLQLLEHVLAQQRFQLR